MSNLSLEEFLCRTGIFLVCDGSLLSFLSLAEWAGVRKVTQINRTHTKHMWPFGNEQLSVILFDYQNSSDLQLFIDVTEVAVLEKKMT